MERFSRDKRLPRPFSYEEFMDAAEKLVVMVRAAHPNVQEEVRTCEDGNTHRYAQVSFVADEVSEALASRPRYLLKELTRPVWERAFDVELSLRDPTAAEPYFVIYLSINKIEESRSLKFYTQQIEETLQKQIERQFARPTPYYKVGDGFPKPSEFNLAFGRRLTGRYGRPHHF
jgi:hypothetical protein